MSRLFTRSELSRPSLEVAFAGRGGLAAGGGETPPPQPPETNGKVYLDLLLKMIPGEVVTLYTFAIKVVPLVVFPGTPVAGATQPGTPAPGPLQIGLAWGLVVLATVLTWVALSLQEPKPTDPTLIRTWKWRLWLATGAFPVWAYATTGDQLYPLPYLPALALILAAVYAVLASIIAKAVAPKPN